MRMGRVGICLGAILSLTVAAGAKGPFGSIHVGNWQGGAFTNDNTGQFSGCIATASYTSGISLSVIIQPDGGWGLGFSHPSWQLQSGETFPIDLTFDGRAQFHVFGNVLTNIMVGAPMPKTSALIGEFRKAKSLMAVAQRQLLQFNLDGTAQLLPTLANCVAMVRQYGLSGVGDFTVRQPPRASVEEASRPPAAAGNPRVDASNASDLQIEAVQLASNFILKSALHNPRVLNRAEVPVAVAPNGAAWSSDEATGFVRIIPPQGNIKGLDVTAAIVAGDAQACKGKFASGRTSDLVDSEVVFRGFSSCEDSVGPRFSQYFVVSRRQGGFVIFSVLSNMKTEAARGVTKDERLVDFRKAALVAASE